MTNYKALLKYLQGPISIVGNGFLFMIFLSCTLTGKAVVLEPTTLIAATEMVVFGLGAAMSIGYTCHALHKIIAEDEQPW